VSRTLKAKGTRKPRKKAADEDGAPAPKRRAKADGAPRRGRKKGTAAEGAAGGAAIAKELPISADNALFSMCLLAQRV
jgi:hypothetical protein